MKTLLIFPLCLFSISLLAQQIADSTFSPIVRHPEYPKGKGPVVTLDEAHFNFHTLNGRYMAFGDLLTKDGYQLARGLEKFSAQSLKKTKVLAIANAEVENDPWRLPTLPAFTPEEVNAVKLWVEKGGSLLLIADHMPFAGSAANLAAAFGFTYYNGFAMKKDIELFYRAKGNLHESSISNGRSKAERVDTIRIFTGQGFGVPPEATVLTSLDSAYTVFMPEVAWEFNDSTKRMSGAGLAHGAYRKFGKGRVVMIGEAAMFSAQLAGPEKNKMGMNHPTAKNNPQLLLNIVHWLDGRIE